MRDLDDLFDALQSSPFRRRMKLGRRERDYLATRGLASVVAHARNLIAERLAPAAPAKDGKQTPFNGHPVFIAQHATGTCCRGCLAKWHHIPKRRELTTVEQHHVVRAIERWLVEQNVESRPPEQHALF
jgi:predicted Fe-S protein YdhL (DUF1289 family)